MSPPASCSDAVRQAAENEHDGDKDRPALAALLTRMTAAYQGPYDACGKSHEPVRQARARDDRGRADRSLLGRASANLPHSSRPERRRRAGRQ